MQAEGREVTAERFGDGRVGRARQQRHLAFDDGDVHLEQVQGSSDLEAGERGAEDDGTRRRPGGPHARGQDSAAQPHRV